MTQNIDINWYDERQNILIFDLKNTSWTVNEMMEAMQESGELIEAVDHPHVTIADTRGSGAYMPPGFLSSFRQIGSTLTSSEHDRGTILITAGGIHQMAAGIFSRAMRRLTLVSSMEEAIQRAEEELAKDG